MYKRALIAAVAIVATTSGGALAQTNVGEVLDAGGKKLTKDELVKLVSIANVSGQTLGGGQFQSDYKADGTFTGTMQTTNMKGGARFGTWTVSDAGLFCTDITSTIVTSSGARQDRSCGYYFKVGEKYFYAPDSDERSTRVLERTVKK